MKRKRSILRSALSLSTLAGIWVLSGAAHAGLLGGASAEAEVGAAVQVGDTAQGALQLPAKALEAGRSAAQDVQVQGQARAGTSLSKAAQTQRSTEAEAQAGARAAGNTATQGAAQMRSTARATVVEGRGALQGAAQQATPRAEGSQRGAMKAQTNASVTAEGQTGPGAVSASGSASVGAAAALQR